MTWKRTTEEPLQRAVNLRVSEATLRRIKRQAGVNGVSAAEYLRGVIAEALERDEANDTGPGE